MMSKALRGNTLPMHLMMLQLKDTKKGNPKIKAKISYYFF